MLSEHNVIYILGKLGGFSFRFNIGIKNDNRYNSKITLSDEAIIYLDK